MAILRKRARGNYYTSEKLIKQSDTKLGERKLDKTANSKKEIHCSK